MERTEGHTLREGFDRLAAGDPSGVPDDLEPALLNEALVGYADSAPLPVAEHLEPYLSAVTAGEDPDPASGLELLAEAPTGVPADEPESGDGPGELEAEWADPVAPQPAPEPFDLDFGAGTTEIYVDEVGAALAAPGSATEVGGAGLGDELPTYEDPGQPVADAGGWLDSPLLDDRDHRDPRDHRDDDRDDPASDGSPTTDA